MSKAAQLALFSMIGLMSTLTHRDGPTKISSHKIEQKRVEEQLSKRALQRMKGKKNRMNRGKNRKIKA